MNDPLFGIDKLDKDLNGIPEKKIVLFSASPSVGNEVFGYQVIYNNIKAGKKVLLMLNRTSPESYLSEMKDYDFLPQSGLDIIDSYSSITGINSSSGKSVTTIDNPYNKEEVSRKLLAELDKGYDLLVLDSFSSQQLKQRVKPLLARRAE